MPQIKSEFCYCYTHWQAVEEPESKNSRKATAESPTSHLLSKDIKFFKHLLPCVPAAAQAWQPHQGICPLGRKWCDAVYMCGRFLQGQKKHSTLGRIMICDGWGVSLGQIQSITSWKFAPLLLTARIARVQEATTCQRGPCLSLLLGASRKASSPHRGFDEQWKM